MPQEYMDCPGCSKPDTPRTLVACFKCWPKLPQSIRARIRNTNPGGAARMRAIGDARLWFKKKRKA